MNTDDFTKRLIDDRINNYDKNKQFETKLFDFKNSLLDKANEFLDSEDLSDDSLRVIADLVAKLNKIDSDSYTDKVIDMFKKIGIIQSEGKDNSENSNIIVNKFLESVLKEDRQC